MLLVGAASPCTENVVAVLIPDEVGVVRGPEVPGELTGEVQLHGQILDELALTTDAELIGVRRGQVLSERAIAVVGLGEVVVRGRAFELAEVLAQVELRTRSALAHEVRDGEAAGGVEPSGATHDLGFSVRPWVPDHAETRAPEADIDDLLAEVVAQDRLVEARTVADGDVVHRLVDVLDEDSEVVRLGRRVERSGGLNPVPVRQRVRVISDRVDVVEVEVARVPDGLVPERVGVSETRLEVVSPAELHLEKRELRVDGHTPAIIEDEVWRVAAAERVVAAESCGRGVIDLVLVLGGLARL